MAGEQTDNKAETAGTQEQAAPDADQKLANMVNSAVRDHLKRNLSKSLEEALNPHITSLRETLMASKPKEETSKPAKGAQESSGDSETQRQIAEMQAALKAEKDARAAEKKQAREDKAFQELRQELQGKVRPEAVDSAAKLLFYADRKVNVDASGTVTLKVGDEEYGLRDGVSEYLKSRDAAIFLPAPGYASGLKKPGQKIPGRSGGNGAVHESPLEKTRRQLAALEGRKTS